MNRATVQGGQAGSGRLVADSAITALAPLIWGSTYLVTTELLPPDRPLLAATVRALPAGLLLLAVGRVLPRGIWWWRALVLGVLNIGAFLYLLFVAAYRLPGGVAALVMAVQPTVVLLLSASLLRTRITPVHVGACALGVAGVGLLVLRPHAALDAVGVAAGLLGAVSMATGIVLTKRWGRPEGRAAQLHGLATDRRRAAPDARHASRRGPARVRHRRQPGGIRLSRPGRRAVLVRGVVPRSGAAARAGGVLPQLRLAAGRDGSRLSRPGPGAVTAPDTGRGDRGRRGGPGPTAPPSGASRPLTRRPGD